MLGCSGRIGLLVGEGSVDGEGWGGVEGWGGGEGWGCRGRVGSWGMPCSEDREVKNISGGVYEG